MAFLFFLFRNGSFKLIKKIILENQDIQITFKLNKKNM